MKEKLPEYLQNKIKLLISRLVIPIIVEMTNLKNSIKSCVQIGSLQEIMNNFEIEMTNGQLKTLNLLKKIIKEVSQQNENILEETLLKYAIIGYDNDKTS